MFSYFDDDLVVYTFVRQENEFNASDLTKEDAYNEYMETFKQKTDL